MPVSLANTPEDVYRAYLEGERNRREEEVYRENKLQNRISQVGQLAQAYQTYTTNKKDRALLNQLGALQGPLSQAQASAPTMEMPFDPGGGARFLTPDQLMAQNAGRGLPQGGIPQAGGMPGMRTMERRLPDPISAPPQGILGRIQQSMNAGAPLSPVETLIAEASIKSMNDPKTALERLKLQRFQQMMGGGQGVGFQGGGPMGAQGTQGSSSGGGQLVPTEYDEYGFPKAYKDPAADLARKRAALEQKREFELTKPMSGEAAGKYSLAKVGVKQIDKIKEMLGLSEDEQGNVTVGKDYKSKIAGLRALAMGDDATAAGNPAYYALAKTVAVAGGSVKDVRQLDLAFNVLAESILRAETGAAATEPEIKRVKNRLIARFLDKPEDMMARLQAGEDFLGGTMEAMRPGQAGTKQPAVPAWVPQSFDYLKARQDGYSDEEIRQHLVKRGLFRS